MKPNMHDGNHLGSRIVAKEDKPSDQFEKKTDSQGCVEKTSPLENGIPPENRSGTRFILPHPSSVPMPTLAKQANILPDT